jgi:hypothetical protein
LRKPFFDLGMFLYQLGCYTTVTSQLGVAGIGKVCGSNDEFDHSFDIADGFDFGNACAISQPQTIFQCHIIAVCGDCTPMESF